MKKQEETLHRLTAEKEWSLFLDRDGVINRHIEGGYVLSTEEMEILPGVPGALAILKKIFKHILIVTNQQCIGLGLVTSEEVDKLHRHMLSMIDPNGEIIDAILVSPHLAGTGNSLRKPGTGMAKKATELFPGIDLERSVMAGDTESDMLFGRGSGMVNILIGKGKMVDGGLFDLKFDSLAEMAHFLDRHSGDPSIG